MAEFEGKLNLNVETSEIEIFGKFKLAEDELDTVAGGGGKVGCSYFEEYKKSITSFYSVCPVGHKSMMCNANCPFYD